MTYPEISTINTTDDLSNLLVYANTITDGLFMPLTLLSFFLVILFASIFASLRFSGRVRPEISFMVAGFSTFGMAVIMSSKDGLLNPSYIFISLAVAILGVLWSYLAREG